MIEANDELMWTFNRDREEVHIVLRRAESGWSVVAIRSGKNEVLYTDPSKEVARMWALQVTPEMFSAQGYSQKPASPPPKEPLALMGEVGKEQWPEIEAALRPLGLEGKREKFRIDRGTASVSFRTAGGESDYYVAGFFDPDDDPNALGLVLSIARMVGGRVTNATGDAVEEQPLLARLRSQVNDLANDVYSLATKKQLVPARVNYAQLAQATPWAEVM